MEKLSEDGRGVYELLRADLAVGLDKRFKEQGADLLKPMEKLIATSTTTIDGLISSRVDEVRGELLMDLEQIRGDNSKESPRCACFVQIQRLCIEDSAALVYCPERVPKHGIFEESKDSVLQTTGYSQSPVAEPSTASECSS